MEEIMKRYRVRQKIDFYLYTTLSKKYILLLLLCVWSTQRYIYIESYTRNK